MPGESELSFTYDIFKNWASKEYNIAVELRQNFFVCDMPLTQINKFLTCFFVDTLNERRQSR